jgi:hypothetical protein
MQTPVLNDKERVPTEQVIFKVIGKTTELWRNLFAYIHITHPDIAEEWRYYNDGKCWLMKVTRKSKTLFWLSVIKGSFIITFYFTDKAEDNIMGSSISDELKEQFRTGKRFNKIRGITVKFKNKKDIDFFKTLLVIKLSIS